MMLPPLFVKLMVLALGAAGVAAIVGFVYRSPLAFQIANSLVGLFVLASLVLLYAKGFMMMAHASRGPAAPPGWVRFSLLAILGLILLGVIGLIVWIWLGSFGVARYAGQAD